MQILSFISWRKIVYYLPLIFPFYLLKFDLFAIPLNVLELTVLILFLGHLLMWGKHYLDLRKRGVRSGVYFLRQNRNFLFFSGLFFLISVLAVAILPHETLLIDGTTLYESRRVALGILKGWIIVPYLWFAMLWFDTDNRKDLFTMLYAYVFSALPLVLWAFLQYVTGDFITLDGRASGPFINANYLAMYLAPAVTALWIMIVRGIVLGFRVERFVIGMILAALYSVALLMTQSYGAMLAVMLSLAVFLLATFAIHRHYQKNFELGVLKKIAYFLLVFALIAVMSALVLFAKTEKWRMFTEFAERSSSSVRLQVYQVSLEFVKQSPVLGIGFGQFEPKYNLEAPEILGHAPFEWVMIHPHNTFLAVWLNFGIFGLFLFLGVLIYAIYRMLQAHDYEEAFFRLIGGMLLLAMILHGIVDTYLFKNDLAMLFWLILALCILPHRKKILESEGN